MTVVASNKKYTFGNNENIYRGKLDGQTGTKREGQCQHVSVQLIDHCHGLVRKSFWKYMNGDEKYLSRERALRQTFKHLFM